MSGHRLRHRTAPLPGFDGDPATITFGAYNANGTARTFFKPKPGLAYWERQPGVPSILYLEGKEHGSRLTQTSEHLRAPFVAFRGCVNRRAVRRRVALPMKSARRAGFSSTLQTMILDILTSNGEPSGLQKACRGAMEARTATRMEPCRAVEKAH